MRNVARLLRSACEIVPPGPRRMTCSAAIDADPDQIARRGLIIAEVDTPGSGGRVDAASQHQSQQANRHRAASSGGRRERSASAAGHRDLPLFEDEPDIATQSRAPEAAGLAIAVDGLTRRSSTTRSKSDAGCIPSVGSFEAWPLRHRPHDIRGDDDNQLGLLALKARGAEQRAKDGRSPSHGNLLISVLVLSWIRPAIAKLSPLPRRIVVSARRTVSAGISRSPIRIAPWVES